MANDRLAEQGLRLETLVQELESALAHAKTAAAHFREGEVPRGCAHTLALIGHIDTAEDEIKAIAKVHRIFSRPQLS